MRMSAYLTVVQALLSNTGDVWQAHHWLSALCRLSSEAVPAAGRAPSGCDAGREEDHARSRRCGLQCAAGAGCARRRVRRGPVWPHTDTVV